MASCERFLYGHGPRRPRTVLAELAERAPEGLEADRYGSGEAIDALEGEVAALFGKPAAAFMPTGVMAETIAMRLFSVGRGNATIAYHPTSHLELHEFKGYSFVHGMRAIELGSPERLFTLDDLREVHDPVGALLIELPQREIGGQLPTWDELVEICEYARSRDMKIHLDGARVWECQPYYGKSYAEIGALFDSVYVSFYKTLGGIAGAMLMGDEGVIAAARVWQRRMGGSVISLYPFALSAANGLHDRLSRIREYVAKARSVAARLREHDRITVVPGEPPTNMMHLYMRGDGERIVARALEYAREHRVWLFKMVIPTESPDLHVQEFTAGDATLRLTDDEIAHAFDYVLR